MPTATTPIVSDEDYRLAAGRHGVEFVNGEIQSKPDSVHAALIKTRLLCQLYESAKPFGPLLGRVGYRCFATEPRRFRKPDLSFVQDDRLPPDSGHLDLLPMPPDFAVEIATPWTLALHLESRVDEYLAAGFGTVWVVWPNVKIVRVYRAGQSSRDYRGDDEITGEPFLPGFRASVRSFFE